MMNSLAIVFFNISGTYETFCQGETDVIYYGYKSECSLYKFGAGHLWLNRTTAVLWTALTKEFIIARFGELLQKYAWRYQCCIICKSCKL